MKAPFRRISIIGFRLKGLELQDKYLSSEKYGIDFSRIEQMNNHLYPGKFPGGPIMGMGVDEEVARKRFRGSWRTGGGGGCGSPPSPKML